MSIAMVETPNDAARRLAAYPLREGHRAEALHTYADTNGDPVFWRIRCKHPDTGAKWIRPMHWNGHAYALGAPAKPAGGWPVYRLPELRAADPAVPVLIVEGEWCVDHLSRLGVIVTTSGGSSSAHGVDWTPLRGRSCRIWPDRDGAGHRYAEEVAAILHAQGCLVTWVDVEALDLPEKGDAVDWLAAHPEATAADVLALPHATTEGPRRTAHLADDGPHVILTRGSDVQPVAVDWLWNGWLAAGKLHLIGGAPGTGKTTLALLLAAILTTGGRWPDGSRAPVGSVLLWSGEDDNRDTLNPRLRAAGAVMFRIATVDGVYEGAERYSFDPARDMDALRVALAARPEVKLVVIDPIVSAVSGDSHKNAEVRRGLQPLVDLAGELHVAVLGVTHFSKGTRGRDPLERITGSLAYGALPRVVMVTVKQEAEGDRPARRLFVRAKSNLGPDGDGFIYDLEQVGVSGYPGIEASVARWGAPVQGAARDLLADAEVASDGPGSGAADFLRALLAGGARTAQEVQAEAREAGYSIHAMYRAAKKIGATSYKSAFTGGWVWRGLNGEDGAQGGEDGTHRESLSSPSSTEAPPSSGAARGEFDL